MNMPSLPLTDLISDILELSEEFPQFSAPLALTLLDCPEDILFPLLSEMVVCNLLSLQVNEYGTIVYERV